MPDSDRVQPILAGRDPVEPDPVDAGAVDVRGGRLLAQTSGLCPLPIPEHRPSPVAVTGRALRLRWLNFRLMDLSFCHLFSNKTSCARGPAAVDLA